MVFASFMGSRPSVELCIEVLIIMKEYYEHVLAESLTYRVLLLCTGFLCESRDWSLNIDGE